MLNRIAENRSRMEVELAGRTARRYFSPHVHALDASLTAALRKHAVGRALDAGCGRQPYRSLIVKLGAEYESLDCKREVDDQTFVGDLQRMPMVESNRFATVLCSEVLEHLPRPSDALKEIHRVLAPGGKVILSVPFLSRLHEEPHDYYRFTRHGLVHMLEAAGFAILHMHVIGSVFGFVGHQISTAFVGGLWHLPGIRWAAFGLNAALVTLPCRLADQMLGSEKAPLGYVVVAVRGPPPHESQSDSTSSPS